MVAEKLIYDIAKQRFLAHFPSILPIEQAYVHIGMFLGWMLENDLYSEEFEEEESLQILRFKQREITCSILSAMWDGYLDEELFSKKGNDFLQYYFQSGKYRQDYQNTLATGLNSMHQVSDTWENYEKIAKTISQKFENWEKKTQNTTEI
jgi:hypothetical protein